MGELVDNTIRWSALCYVAVVAAVHERCYVRLERVRRERRQVERLPVVPRRERRYGIGNLVLLLGFRLKHPEWDGQEMLLCGRALYKLINIIIREHE